MSTFLAHSSFHGENCLGDPSHSSQLCHMPGTVPALTGLHTRGTAIKPLFMFAPSLHMHRPWTMSPFYR